MIKSEAIKACGHINELGDGILESKDAGEAVFKALLRHFPTRRYPGLWLTIVDDLKIATRDCLYELNL